jgi:hypothetical protein
LRDEENAKLYVSSDVSSGIIVNSGETYSIANLPFGDSEYQFKVVTNNGTTKIYSLIINRAYEDVPYADSIEVFSNEAGNENSTVELTRKFVGEESTYYANVEYEQTEVWIKTLISDAAIDDGYTIRTDNTPVNSGEMFNKQLNVGDNIATVVITNAIGDTRTYTVVINRADKSVDTMPKLEDLEAVGYELVPLFEPEVRDYTVFVTDGSDSIDIIARYDESALNATINNVESKSGEAYTVEGLKQGENYVDVVVASNDSEDTKVHYTVKVIVTDKETKLDYLGLSEGSIAPVFNPDIHTYYTTVPYEVEEVTIYTEMTSTTEIINGKETTVTGHITSGSGTVENGNVTVKLIAGKDNTAVINVFDSDDAKYMTGTYTVIINRKAAEGKAVDLSEITLTDEDGNEIELTTEFSGRDDSYADFNGRDVNYYAYTTASKVIIGASAADTNASVSGVGAVDTDEQLNTAIITVANGSNKQRYSLTIINPSSAASISGVSVNGESADMSGYADVIKVDADTETIKLNVDGAGEIRVNGHILDNNEFTMSTDREKYVITSEKSGDITEYTLYVYKDKEEFGPGLKSILVEKSEMVSKDPVSLNNVPFISTLYKYTATVDTADVWLFALAKNSGTYIEVFDEELNDYAIVQNLNGYVQSTIGDREKMTYIFRATGFAQSGFENTADYELVVYRSDKLLLSDLYTDSNAQMVEPFDPLTNDYTAYISRTGTTFDVTAKAFDLDAIVTITAKYTNADGETVSVDITEESYDAEYGKSKLTSTLSNLPEDVDDFEVTVNVDYDDMDSNKHNEYTISVSRSDLKVSDVYLENLLITDETDSDDDLYKLIGLQEVENTYNENGFAKTVREYKTTIGYTDRTLGLTLVAEEPNDVLSIKIGDNNAIDNIVSGKEGTYLLPVDLLTDDDNSTVVKIIVTRNNKDIGEYKLTVYRDDRLQGEGRLATLETDPEMTPEFDPETSKYVVNTTMSTTQIDINAIPATPSDLVVIRHTTSSNADGNDIVYSGPGGLGTYDLETNGDTTDVFFVTVSSADGLTSEFTYVVEVVRRNSIWAENLTVDEYELSPVFDKQVSAYEVSIPALATEITFHLTADKDYGLSASFKDNAAETMSDIEDGTMVTEDGYTTLTVTKELAVSSDVYTFEFNVTRTDGMTGKYVVTVKRDTPGELLMQTTIKGRIRTMSENNHATIEVYKDGDLYKTIDAKPEDGETTYDGRFAFTIDNSEDIGTYSMIVKRPGYLNYYINNIAVDKTYVAAEYDFGNLEMIAGDIVTYGSSEDKIDKSDLTYFKRLLNGAEVTQGELDGSGDTSVVYSVNAPKEEAKDTTETKPDNEAADGNEATTPDNETVDGNEARKPDNEAVDGSEATTPDNETVDGSEATTPNDEHADSDKSNTEVNDNSASTEASGSTESSSTSTTAASGSTESSSTSTTTASGSTESSSTSTTAASGSTESSSTSTSTVSMVMGVVDYADDYEAIKVEAAEDAEEEAAAEDAAAENNSELKDIEHAGSNGYDGYYGGAVTKSANLICDFNEDGIINSIDLTHLALNIGRKAYVVDNSDKTDRRRAVLSELKSE